MSFESECVTDPASLERASRDFGGVVDRRPVAVVRPRTVEEVVRAVTFASREGLPIAARGEGHTTRGQALVAGGVVLEMAGFDQIRVEGERLIAGAGALWSEVLRVALRMGKTPPVLTDYLGLSVGGTLSVGGVGGQSFAHGLQTCNVEALTVVTGQGETVRCSQTEHPDLFDACRGGLGQCALIVEAELRLVAAPRRVRAFELRYGDAATLLSDQAIAAASGAFDYILASTPVDEGGRFTFKIELVSYDHGALHPDRELLRELHPVTVTATDTTYHEHANRLTALAPILKSGPHHPWMDLFVGGSTALELVELAHTEFDPQQWTDGHIMTYPLFLSRCHTPILDLADEPYFLLLDLLPTAHHREQLASLEEDCLRILELARACGARIYPIGYPVGTPRMRAADWQRQYTWDRFAHAKRTYDPRGILTPGPALFDR